MESQTILLIFLAAISALGIAVFQYLKSKKERTKRSFMLALLRFVSIFGILLLLINPKFTNTSYVLEKSNLVLAVDNSQSINYFKSTDEVTAFVASIRENINIQKKYNISTFTFGNKLKAQDTFSFSENQTNVTSAFKELQDIYKGKVAPTVIITDGNQTYGEAYQYAAKKYKQDVYPVIVGDTTSYQDLKISQLNANRYAFLNNKFPVEIIANYNGNSAVSTKLNVFQNGRVIYSQPLSFSKEKTSEIVQVTLPVTSIGVKTYTVSLQALDAEKNTVNNKKSFGIEVIDERTNVLILTSIIHPDLGTLKKAIESNEQRNVTIKKSDEPDINLKDYQAVLLYQPNVSFKPYYETIKTLGINTFTITGTRTDYRFLNDNGELFTRELSAQVEDYQAEFNSNFSTFQVDDIGFSNFPPLVDEFGEVSIKKAHTPLLMQTISGLPTGSSLLTTIEDGAQRHAVLFGEGIWRWRAQSYLDNQSFEAFDEFVGKLIQYLASKERRNRLNINYNSFYNGGDNIVIAAQYFDKNYEFDARAKLSMVVIGERNNTRQEIPMVLKNNRYEVDLSSLTPDSYKFSVTVAGESISRSGNFEIIEFNVEQQFLSANVTPLQQIATNTNKELYSMGNSAQLITNLLENETYNPIQKQQKQIKPLIDWYYLLGIIILTLSLEWFIRKYNGLI
ncbi:vWA domain-containing protein [Croceibacter atlanticus]|uniref:vWA domain-containing protein n=1 Tax=Croceibacter atlanticus TaxID=313588 RepID=UPI001C5DC081|nr:vWA domain-containing protein [Croceibacter atlanticus]MBW4969148.1 VWA domain-containing protein [Croceibacter atlanticus]